jgi:hypothetical protein
MGASREIETQYTPTAAPNASATSATYVLLPMGTFMELKTQETPTQAPYTPATNTTKILQRDDCLPFVRDVSPNATPPPPSNKVTYSLTILNLLGTLLAMVSFFMLLFATRILHLQTPEVYTRTLLNFFLLPLSKAMMLLRAYTCHSTAALLTTSCVHHQVNNREDSAACNVASSAVSRCFNPRRQSPPWMPLRLVFRRQTLELPLRRGRRQQVPARWLAWEKARKDWLAKGGYMGVWGRAVELKEGIFG